MKLLLNVLSFVGIYLLVDLVRSEVSLSDDPALFPGHLQPIGSGRPISKVKQIDGFPEPNDFFANYVHSKSKKAVIFKGGAKLSPAFNLWSDDYLRDHPESDTMQFDIEKGKKEDRKGNMMKRSVKDFINSYHTDDIYAVSDVPDQLKNQFLLPPPIRCNNIKDKLSMMLMWFSSGGTKSVLHQDSFENINCLYRGSKRLLIVEYPKYKKQVVIDRPNGYSSVDVEKVDFTKYPSLREVEYWEAEMEAGDCLYIPFQWFHQVNSFPNENNTNIAVNVWWHYNDSYKPKDCNMKPEEATLDKFTFGDAVAEAYSGGDGNEPKDVMNIFFGYYKEKNTGSIPFEEFAKDLDTEDSSLAELGVYEIRNKKRHTQFAREFYDALDTDSNGVVDYVDFNALEDEDARKLQKKVYKTSKKLDRYFAWQEKKSKDGKVSGENDEVAKSNKPTKEEL